MWGLSLERIRGLALWRCFLPAQLDKISLKRHCRLYPSIDGKTNIKIFLFGGKTMVFEAIAEIIAERNDCDVSEIKEDSTFQELGIDSLDTVEMIMELEDKLGKEIELDQKVETVGDLVKFIEEKYDL